MKPYLRRMVLLMAAMILVTHSYAKAQGSDLKPLAHGLVSMGNIVFHRHDGGIPDNSLQNINALPGVFDGVAVNVTWAQLQPAEGSLTTEAIDQALAQVRTYNNAYPNSPLYVRLRIWPGPQAPDWVKDIGGAPITILHTNIAITVGRFWSAPYRNAWRKLQDQLAAKYDQEPLIWSVENSSCSTITDEPFVLPGDVLSLENLHNAGFNDQDFQDCLMQSGNDYAQWKTTRVEYPFNPFRAMDSGRPQMIEQFTLNVMKSFRQNLGPRGILSNHSLSANPPQRIKLIYDNIEALGPPIELQMYSPDTAYWEGAVELGVSLGASAIELWPAVNKKKRGFEGMPMETLQEWSAAIKKNHAP